MSSSKPRFRKVNSSLEWQVADDPEWEFAQTSHMPLYAGSHHKAEKEPLVSLSTNIDEDSSAIRIRRNVELSSSGQGIISHLLTDLRGDYGNIALLVFLYILQGVPLGLTASIPLVLQNRHVSYGQQAIFSFAYWPFSLKLFWAPLVDSCYWFKIGRRKSWLIPTQYMIGLFMLILSSYVNNVLGAEEGGANAAAPNVLYLTSVFFAFNFLAATQDIAVDGWALTMLSKKNVGYASTCNAVGQTAGYFLGNVVFLALESSEFCNKYLRSEPKTQGLVTLADFCYYWSWIFMITTTLVLLFKRENDSISKPECSQGKIKPKDPEDLSLVDTYKLLWDIVRLKPVLLLIFIHLTAKFAFAAADGITGLKLIELGVPKDKLAFIAVPLVPLQIFLPIFIGKFTAGPTPLNVYIKAYPYRIILGLFFMLLVYWTPSFQQTDGHYPVSYYLIIIFAYCLHQITVYSIFVAIMAFHAQISDPIVGGTYMTLMNTVSNLGGNWPVTFLLSIVDRFTWKECLKGDATSTPLLSLGPCDNETVCQASGGRCQVTLDGYYILSVVCACVGFLWWRLMKRRLDRLQRLDKSSWTLAKMGR